MVSRGPSMLTCRLLLKGLQGPRCPLAGHSEATVGNGVVSKAAGMDIASVVRDSVTTPVQMYNLLVANGIGYYPTINVLICEPARLPRWLGSSAS